MQVKSPFYKTFPDPSVPAPDLCTLHRAVCLSLCEGSSDVSFGFVIPSPSRMEGIVGSGLGDGLVQQCKEKRTMNPLETLLTALPINTVFRRAFVKDLKKRKKKTESPGKE